MIAYNKKWNKDHEKQTLALTVENRAIASREFIDEDGFNLAMKDLAKQREGWNASDQFIGKTLVVRVL